MIKTCTVCNGRGKIYGSTTIIHTCTNCAGTGVIETSDSISDSLGVAVIKYCTDVPTMLDILIEETRKTNIILTELSDEIKTFRSGKDIIQ